jgi:hypothetical protein
MKSCKAARLSTFEVREDHFSSLWTQHHQQSRYTCIASDDIALSSNLRTPLLPVLRTNVREVRTLALCRVTGLRQPM